MITGAQMRASRATLRWTAAQLAERSGISLPTVQRLEQHEGIPPSHTSTLVSIKATLEAAGIEFIGTPEDAPGIRLRR